MPPEKRLQFDKTQLNEGTGLREAVASRRAAKKRNIDPAKCATQAYGFSHVGVSHVRWAQLAVFFGKQLVAGNRLLS